MFLFLWFVGKLLLTTFWNLLYVKKVLYRLSGGYEIFILFCCRGHWSLLVLCHFDETDCSDIKKGPRMIVLDSLNTTDPTRLQSLIRRCAPFMPLILYPKWCKQNQYAKCIYLIFYYGYTYRQYIHTRFN
jgi:hypothetical protein